MNIKINLTTKKTLNLTIYHDFTEFENGEISPIAGSLLVSGTMLNGNFNGTIRVTSLMIYILIQAYDNNANQMFYQAVVEATPDGIIITD
ncbi:hypothetical protein C0W93_18405 [Photobacterium leiognathi subsp. mandapamensis]|uniref:Uncharacterized protein n=2 Tax=Photobacterium leiognathi TaxID=553611 RepID=A0A2T3KQT2_PHOLD|nr:hypothetical protein C0W93_18405 [Photobacterium leiognathi subsp. mandapamensis]